jgi:MFS-type transporter involved in bile tolerance (Atg22 family)
VFICIGALADFGGLRKRILLGASFAGAVSALACAGITPASWWIAAPLMIISNVLSGVAMVMQVR